MQRTRHAHRGHGMRVWAISLMVLLAIGLAVLPVQAEPFAYIPNAGRGFEVTVSVIDTATNTVLGAPISVGVGPSGVAVHPVGMRVYVTNNTSSTVSVIDTATHTVTATIPVDNGPFGVAVHPAGTRVYVANNGSNTVSVIDTATNTVTATISVGFGPVAFGQFIGGAPLTPLSSCVWGLFIDDHTSGGSWESRLFLANLDPQQAYTYEVAVLATETVRRTSLRLGPSGMVQVNCGDVPACGVAGWLSVQSDAPVFGATLFVINNTLGGGSFTAQTPVCQFGVP